MSFVTKVKNRSAWLVRKTKKYSKRIYHRYFGIEIENAQTNILPDTIYLKKLYRARTGKELNLKHPKTFNEKLNWMKIHDRNHIFSVMVDKYLVKNYVAEIIGKKYIIPTLGVWNSYQEIDFKKLPNKFVLKCTHDSGGVKVCKNKNAINHEEFKQYFDWRLSRNYYKICREWPYKNVKRRIIAEEFIEDDLNPELRVYKVFNFDGVPKIIQMITGDKTDHEYINYYDTEWNFLDLRQNFPNGPIDEKPVCLHKILELATKLSCGRPFIRTDFYVVNGEVLFSEFTFYSDAGLANFVPDEWDRKLGDMLHLPCD